MRKSSGTKRGTGLEQKEEKIWNRRRNRSGTEGGIGLEQKEKLWNRRSSAGCSGQDKENITEMGTSIISPFRKYAKERGIFFYLKFD